MTERESPEIHQFVIYKNDELQANAYDERIVRRIALHNSKHRKDRISLLNTLVYLYYDSISKRRDPRQLSEILSIAEQTKDDTILRPNQSVIRYVRFEVHISAMLLRILEDLDCLYPPQDVMPMRNDLIGQLAFLGYAIPTCFEEYEALRNELRKRAQAT